MSDYLEVQLRKHLFRTGSFTKPTALWISLHTADPTDAGSGAEVSGGNYARQELDPGDANWSGVSATDGLAKNLTAITFPAPTAGWGTVTHFAIWDAGSGGNMLISAALTTPKVVNSGDGAPFFDVNTLVVTFA